LASTPSLDPLGLENRPPLRMTQLAPPRNCNGTNLSIKKEKLSPLQRGESQLSHVVDAVVLFKILALPTSPRLSDLEPLGL
jgi:hypothetical protein